MENVKLKIKWNRKVVLGKRSDLALKKITTSETKKGLNIKKKLINEQRNLKLLLSNEG